MFPNFEKYDRIHSKIAAVLAGLLAVAFFASGLYLLFAGFWGEGIVFLLFTALPAFGAVKAWRKYS